MRGPRTATFAPIASRIVESLAATAVDADPDAALLSDQLGTALCAQLVPRHSSDGQPHTDFAEHATR